MGQTAVTLRHWLYPVALFYGMGVRFRDKLFDWGILRSESFDLPVICVGNLTVGGTGKTPLSEYLIELLRREFRVALLSRGYKRKTKGFLLANKASTADCIGDEPYQVACKFTDCLVAVDENRRRGIKQLLSLPADRKPEVIVLDDAFQHRYVKPSLTILLSRYDRLCVHDELMPVGHLRAPMNRIDAVDIMIVTKCSKTMSPMDRRIIKETLALRPHQTLLFSYVNYGELTPVFPEVYQQDGSEQEVHKALTKEDEVLLIAGIASPKHYEEELQRRSKTVETMPFGDHHRLTTKDIKSITKRFESKEKNRRWLLVTEKDAARLKNQKEIPTAWKPYLYYYPIKMHFFEDSAVEFNEMIIKHIRNYGKDRNCNLRGVWVNRTSN